MLMIFQVFAGPTVGLHGAVALSAEPASSIGRGHVIMAEEWRQQDPAPVPLFGIRRHQQHAFLQGQVDVQRFYCLSWCN